MELLGSAGMAREDIGLTGRKKFNKVGANVALTVRERFSIVDSGQEEGFTIGVVGVGGGRERRGCDMGMKG